MKPLSNKNAVLVVGQRINCHLYGGKDGIIWKIEGEQTPATIQTLGKGCIVTGGNAQFHIVYDSGARTIVPEAIVRGVQWTIYEEVATAAEIVDALRFADAEDIREKIDAELTQERRQSDREQFAKEYPHLERVAPGTHPNATLAAKNIRKELKAAFPETAFSVRSDNDSVNIHWTLGPSSHDVEQITGKYKKGSFNGMEDIYEYDHDNVFPDLFGGSRYVFCQRELDESSVTIIAEALCKLYDVPIPENNQFWKTSISKLGDTAAVLANRILYAQSYPPCAVITGIEREDDSPCGYRATFTIEKKTKEELAAAHAARFTGFNRIRYGFAAPGEVQEGFEMIGHYTRLSDAEKAQEANPGSKRKDYIHGFKKRGWVVYRAVPQPAPEAPADTPAPDAAPITTPANVIPLPTPQTRLAEALARLNAL